MYKNDLLEDLIIYIIETYEVYAIRFKAKKIV